MNLLIKFSIIGFFFLPAWLFAQASYEEVLKTADDKAAKQDYAGALVDYDLLIRKNPREYELYYKRGMALYYSYDYNRAVIDLSKATLSEEFAESAYLFRGRVRTDAKQYLSALEDFGKVVKRNPENMEVYRWRGKCKLQMGKITKGLFDLEVFAEFAPKTWENYHLLVKDILQTQANNPNALLQAESWLNESLLLQKNSINQRTKAELEKLLGRPLAKLQPKTEKEPDFSVTARKVKQDSTKKNLDLTTTQQTKPSEKKPENKVVPIKTQNLPSTEENLDLVIEFKKAKIWAVVVGVSKFKNSELNLQYADRDALSYAEFLRSPNGGALPANQLTVLTNEKATRSNIIKALNETFNQAFESDIILFYIASHGQPDPVGEEVYFLTYDTDSENLNGTGLGQNDVEKYFVKSKAKRKIWLADACHSGGAGLSAGVRGPTNLLANKLLDAMATSNQGMGILTASSASELSYENAQWGGGHGVFTHHLLEGLKGKANLPNAYNKLDSFISIRELYEYVYRQVVADTKGKQHPELKGRFDNDFPLSTIK
jgi:tetratricopeptide (TPR) repeat protein